MLYLYICLYFFQDTTGEDDIDLNGEVWVETKADGGKSYFYNARTRETTWTRPEEKEGVRVLTQDQVDKLTQKLSNSEKKDEQQQQQQPDQQQPPYGMQGGYGMPPPGYGQGPPPGFAPPHGYPPPWAMGGPGGPPQGFPPPGSWGMPPGQGGPGPGMEICEWTEHTAPDGKFQAIFLTKIRLNSTIYYTKNTPEK